MAFFKKPAPKKSYDGPPLDPEWARNRHDKFHRLYHLDPIVEGLEGKSAVYVIWHSGVKPQWVYVGKTDNLAYAVQQAQEDEDITQYEKNGGLYITWSPVLKDRQNGVVRFLHEAMQPIVPNPTAAGIKDGPINVLVPKRRAD